tara:strand:- start:115 stop:2223 length:2109 start_codon:yes stop_codon:yes gene_type:complete
MKDLLHQIRNSHNLFFKIFITLVSIGLIVYIFPREAQFGYEYQKNSPWLHEDFIAPFDFPILKSEEQMKREADDIRENAIPYFDFDQKSTATSQQDLLDDFDKQWESYFEDTYGSERKMRQATPFQTKEGMRSGYRKKVAETFAEIMDQGIIENIPIVQEADENTTIILVKDKVENEFEISRFYSMQEAYDAARKKLENIPVQNDISFLASLISDYLKPNVLYNQKLSEQVVQEKLDLIANTYGKVAKGEKIIERGDIVTDEAFRKLESIAVEYGQQTGGSNDYWFILIGQILLISVAVGVLFFFLSIFRRDVIIETKKTVFVLFVFTLNAYLASLANYVDIIHIYMLPFVLLPIIVRTFFDTRLAAFVHSTSIILIGLLAPNPFEFVFIQTMVGLIAIFSLTGLRKRSQLLLTVAIVFGAYCINYLGFSAIQEGSLSNVNWNYMGHFGISAVLTLFIYPLIYIFEKLFGFLSDVTLMELSDTNAPLLRKLASKAPGTFQHSMQVANLSEEAAVAVGADPLLVRTGALYHDIGKMKNPIYFIENQLGEANPHADLDYEESAQIIIGHVIAGIEMAKKANLPEQVIDFIRSHHGTSVTRFFYNMKRKTNPDVSKENFQYPGPIPFSKETAILMMADSVEAAARSLKTHTAETIGNLVDNIINHQAEEEQFVNANITFKDISTLKKLFKKRLMSIYHVRVEYPK